MKERGEECLGVEQSYQYRLDNHLTEEYDLKIYS